MTTGPADDAAAVAAAADDAVAAGDVAYDASFSYCPLVVVVEEGVVVDMVADVAVADDDVAATVATVAGDNIPGVQVELSKPERSPVQP